MSEKPPYQPSDLRRLTAEVSYRTRLQAVCNRIYAARNLNTLFVFLEADIALLFQAERFTVYGLDGVRRHLVSRFKSGDDIQEIRIPVSSASIAGYTAMKQRVVNIRDVHDQAELKGVDPELCFDERWDHGSGYTTADPLRPHPV